MERKVNIVFIITLTVLVGILLLIPTGFEQSGYNENTHRVKAEVIEVDNSNVRINGIVKSGDQKVTVEVSKGVYKEEKIESNNMLVGKMELDKLFEVGDSVLVAIQSNESGDIIYANVVDHYRLNIEFFLVVMFILVLIAISGWVGVKSILSFIFTILTIWKILLPGFLKGYNPIILSILVVILITFVIIFLVAGFTKKGLVAFIGAVSGEVLTCILALVFGASMNIHGSVLQYAETLLYSGFPTLDLTAIFLSGIFLASSGAVMDVAMDIAASLNEVKEKKPDISMKELVVSGLNVCRAVIGTMTTTLLLAYSGGYTAVMMTFIAQGTPIVNILNMKYISAEILHTIVGSFGLVMVAPFTVLVGSFIYTKKNWPKHD